MRAGGKPSMNFSEKLIDFVNNAFDSNYLKTEKLGLEMGEIISRSLLDRDKFLKMLSSVVHPKHERTFCAHFHAGYTLGQDKKPLTNASGIRKSNKLNGLEINEVLNDALEKFEVLEDDLGRRNQILEKFPYQVYKSVNLDKLAIIAAKALTNATGELWGIDPATKAVETWKAHTDPFNGSISPVGFINDQKPAFFKTDIVPVGESHPLFSEFLSRVSNSKALCAFIWSLFEPGSNTHQYLWIYGDGGNGKSSLGDFLSRCLGPSYMSKNAVNSYGNRNFSATLVGKRLAVFEDSNSTRFIQSGQFKEVTGGGSVEVEAKYENSYTTKLFVKFLFLSNFAPELSSKKADLRRIILCKVAPIVGELYLDYNDMLWEERAGILHTCKLAYEESILNGFIQVDSQIGTQNASISELCFSDIFEDYLINEGEIDLNELYSWVKGALVTNKVSFLQFYDWLLRKYSLVLDKTTIRGISKRG